MVGQPEHPLNRDIAVPPAAAAARPGPDLVTVATTIGVVAVGAALLEAALIPGIVIGGAAVLAPRYLPRLRRRWFGSAKPRRAAVAPLVLDHQDDVATPRRFAITQAVMKTVTFRVIVTTLDFSANWIVIGEPLTAAGLSAFSTVAGPVFYFFHEAAWHRIGADPRGAAVVRLPQGRSLTINRALGKTITYRVFATAMEFTTNYVVVQDVATAALLSSFGFVLGPFVYYGHELAWERFGSRAKPVAEPSIQLALPAPTQA